MQLVCVDRRYQRMNCFNIRELQGVLKRKFFTDLVNTNDHRDFLNQSILGLRFKSNNQLSITPDLESFFNLGLTTNTKVKSNLFQSTYNELNFKNFLNTNSTFFSFSYTLGVFNLVITNLLNLFTSINFSSLLPINYLFNSIMLCFTSNLNQPILSSQSLSHRYFNNVNNIPSEKKIVYSTDNLNVVSQNELMKNNLSETSNNARFTRFNNPLISYDYKCGHYLGI
jgi:hypothetical protein